jgi:uncharacterized membrane protein
MIGAEMLKKNGSAAKNHSAGRDGKFRGCSVDKARWMLPAGLFLVVLTIYCSPVFGQDFTIDNFHSDITINADSSFSVRETLAIKFQELKHGIFREIPYRYTDERGNAIRTPLSVLSVTDESGKGWNYRVTRKGNIVNIKIGDPKIYVDGTKTYVITYRVENAILFFEDHDELYWNVTGNYWWAPIRQASATVALAVKDKSENLWAACYTGALGSKATDCGFETSHNSAEFFTNKNLASREGFTIAFGWSKGLVVPPSSWKKFLWAINLKENWIFFLPVFSLLFMTNLWHTRGRDPKVREAVAVRYEPPKCDNKPLAPGEVGTIVDERLDSRDITSTIVGLAVRGYIKIEEAKTEGLIFDSTDYYLAKVKEADDNLGAFEKVLMQNIFTTGLPGRMVSDLKNSFFAKLDLLKTTMYGELTGKKYFFVSPEKVRKHYIVAGIIVAIAGIFALQLLAPSGVGKGVIAGILTGLPVLAFARVMPVKTKAGASVYMEILGFQEFMRRAEKGQLERMGDKELFSKFLPYAIALDVVDNWAKAFEGIFQEQPQWYVSQTGVRTFSPYHFSRSINSATSSLASAMYAAPRGSGISGGGGGFSGGGFSGGGFGGGGGGSW